MIWLSIQKIEEASAFLKEVLKMIPDCNDPGELFAFEGSAAKVYFGVFNELILQQKLISLANDHVDHLWIT